MLISLLAQLTRLHRQTLDLAGALARASRSEMPQLIDRRLARMTYFEARGYLRVHAVPAVEAVLEADQHGLAIPAALRSVVRDQAVVMLINRVLADRAMSPPTRVRRAA